MLRSLVLLALWLCLLHRHWNLIVVWSILIVFERHCCLLLLHHLSWWAALTRSSARWWTPTSPHHHMCISITAHSPRHHPTTISSIRYLLLLRVLPSLVLLLLLRHCRVLELSLRRHDWIGVHSTRDERLRARLNFKKRVRALLAVLVLSHKVVY